MKIIHNAVNVLPVEDASNAGQVFFLPTGEQYITKSDGSYLEISNSIFVSTLPLIGISNKIYILSDGNKSTIHVWNGTEFEELTPTITKDDIGLSNVVNVEQANKVEFDNHVNDTNIHTLLGETSITAYRGDRGKIAYDHSQVVHAPSNAQKNSDITKVEIESKLTGSIITHTHPVSSVSGLQTSLDGKVDKVTGKQLSTNDYTNAEKTLVAQIPQKANQSFVDAQFATIVSGAPKGTYSTLSALQAAYPTGTTGIFLVLADGHWYYWQSTTSAWTDGGDYMPSQVPKSALNVQLINSDNIPNYDQTTKIFNFNSTQYYESILVYGNETYVIPAGTTVVNPSSSSAVKLIFNTVTKNFYIASAITSITSDEIILATIRDRNQYVCHITAPFETTINGFAIGDTMRNHMLKPVRVLVGGKNYPIVDSTAKTLTFPSNLYDWGVYIGNTVYANAIPTSGLTIDLSTATGTTAWCILFNLSTKAFLLVPWNGLDNYVKTHALFATFRIDGGKYYFDMPCHYIMDGKLFGEVPLTNDNLIGGVVENRLDAFIKAIAHRGYSTEAPENTLPSYRLAKRKGFSYVECDVQWTSDNVPVLLHDNTIDRTSNGTGNITSMTLAQVKEYDFGAWKDTKYAGTKIPTFEEFIILCKKLNLHAYIELKGGINATKAQILVNILKKLGMIKNVTFISFTDSYLADILAILPTARVALLGTMTQTLIDKAIALQTEQNDVFINTDNYLLDVALVESAILSGIPVEVWTVNNTTRVHELVAMGISGISTDTLNIAEVLSE